jgi:pimeloyl-ACP methyl ester carboxylesterase
MKRKTKLFLGGVAAAAILVGGAIVVARERRGRELYRADMKLPVSCVDASDLRLQDGRLISFHLSGPGDGTPVVYFHGLLGSRLDWPATPGAADAAKVRLIAIDRPGYGCSDPKPGRTLLQWPDDVRQVLDRLGISKFRIIAWSGGTPYALACGYRMPDRVTRIDLAGAVAPESYAEGKAQRDQSLSRFALLAQYVPGIAYAGLRQTVVRREKEPDWFEDRLARGLSKVDQELVHQPDIRRVLKRTHATGESRIAVGLVEDLETLGGPWGFKPSDVKTPVVMWQGSEDTLTPAIRSARLATELPNVKVKLFPGEGHFLIYRHEAELLR